MGWQVAPFVLVLACRLPVMSLRWNSALLETVVDSLFWTPTWCQGQMHEESGESQTQDHLQQTIHNPWKGWKPDFMFSSTQGWYRYLTSLEWVMQWFEQCALGPLVSTAHHEYTAVFGQNWYQHDRCRYWRNVFKLCVTHIFNHAWRDWFQTFFPRRDSSSRCSPPWSMGTFFDGGKTLALYLCTRFAQVR